VYGEKEVCHRNNDWQVEEGEKKASTGFVILREKKKFFFCLMIKHTLVAISSRFLYIHIIFDYREEFIFI
jgi:hypothetical protein